MPDWALATTPPNAERLVAADLESHGYDHWLFKRSVTRAYRGQVSEFHLPAFPRYIFVPFEAAWEVILDVWRILGFVCFGDQIARVRECDVDYLVDRCGGSDVLPPEIIPEPYARGERVHVGGYGLISGHDAIYDRVVENGKLRVLFDMMGRMVPIDVDECDVSTIVRKRCRKRRRNGRRQTHRETG